MCESSFDLQFSLYDKSDDENTSVRYNMVYSGLYECNEYNAL